MRIEANANPPIMVIAIETKKASQSSGTIPRIVVVAASITGRNLDILAILIACIGIFGLSSYSVQQRRSEIGIRKVLGATVLNIVAMLSKDYLRLILIALVVATPISWYLMNRWLQDFTYRINLDVWTFVVAGAITLIIAGCTVSYQNIKAALSNPVNAIQN